MNPLIIGIIAVIALAAVFMIIMGQRRTRELSDKFGPEYERTLKSMRDRGKAESELLKRKERVEHLQIRPLMAADRQRFEQRWKEDQARFVDDPRAAVKEADRLVAELMQVRGYPVADFEQRAADVSVSHPHVVSEYRQAHDIADRDARGEATTEELRSAMVHYRALFTELLIDDTAGRDDRTLRSDRPVETERPIRADRPVTSDRPALGGDRIIRDDVRRDDRPPA
jgi:hypothetical protein